MRARQRPWAVLALLALLVGVAAGSPDAASTFVDAPAASGYQQQLQRESFAAATAAAAAAAAASPSRARLAAYSLPPLPAGGEDGSYVSTSSIAYKARSQTSAAQPAPARMPGTPRGAAAPGGVGAAPVTPGSGAGRPDVVVPPAMLPAAAALAGRGGPGGAGGAGDGSKVVMAAKEGGTAAARVAHACARTSCAGRAGKPRAGEPRAGEPRAGEPRGSEPGADEPGAGEPGAGEPSAGEPSAGEPGAGEPSAGEPGAGQPGAGEPGAGEPGAGEPGAGEPGAGEPSAGEPGAGQPGAGEPGAGEPGAGEPRAGEPSAGQPGAGEPRASEPSAGQPGAGEPRASEPRTCEPGAGEPRARPGRDDEGDSAQPARGTAAAPAPAAAPNPSAPPTTPVAPPVRAVPLGPAPRVVVLENSTSVAVANASVTTVRQVTVTNVTTTTTVSTTQVLTTTTSTDGDGNGAAPPVSTMVATPSGGAGGAATAKPSLGPVEMPPPSPAAGGAAAAAPAARAASAAPRAPAVAAAPAEAIVPNPAPWVFRQPGAKGNITLGVMMPLQGSQRIAGEAAVVGVRMAITDLAPKLLPGLDVVLDIANSRCKDIPAFNAMTALADAKVAGVVGEFCSSASVGAAGVANARKVPLISPASTSPSLSQADYFFRTVPSDRYQGVAAAKLVARRGARVVGLAYEDNAYGYGLAFNFIAGFTNAGGSVPVVYSFKSGEANATDAVDKMLFGRKYKRPPIQAVFIATNDLRFVSDFAAAAVAAKLDLPLYGGDSTSDATVWSNLAQAASPAAAQSALGTFISTLPAPGPDSFAQAFAKFSPGTTYQSFSAQAYDATDALLRALAAAGPPFAGPAVVAALQKQKFEGMTGPVEFDAFGDLRPHAKAYAWTQFDPKTGQPVVKGLAPFERR
ncbi:Atf7ip [Scenedesmus sp. PABB004]|nr:Atf7ip [Scenedesmus sp. PABB004]